MSELVNTVSALKCEDEDKDDDGGPIRLAAEATNSACAPTSHNDSTSPSAQFSSENGSSNTAPPDDVSVKLAEAESKDKKPAKERLKFCAMLGRPDTDAEQMALSIPDKMLVRASKTTDSQHVLVMGSVDLMEDPLPCPFAAQVEAC
ncbi:uncharacterized protein LOC129587372 isoform X1 [Paramacrobiotus metropolitanus]|uniref:uncharacterized protein LOC129587372 isoform X1 n=1 Tax=Paramacrobiotus metropolitanus TaxID=2943436 RepID=UPI002445FECD|nr:uncharacterized protein LOC129587372 isoform X1 [Paramacrobiotus metropolitanus]